MVKDTRSLRPARPVPLVVERLRCPHDHFSLNVAALAAAMMISKRCHDRDSKLLSGLRSFALTLAAVVSHCLENAGEGASFLTGWRRLRRGEVIRVAAIFTEPSSQTVGRSARCRGRLMTAMLGVNLADAAGGIIGGPAIAGHRIRRADWWGHQRDHRARYGP